METSSPTLSGGMGTVVICKDPHLDRTVAIKFLSPGSDRRRIQDEVKALQRIRSKHVVQVYDVIIQQPGNQVGIVQEYLPGHDLCALCKPADVGAFLRIVYQLAVGVEDIHLQQLIHRDLKPNNVKCDQEKLLKIFDFGLSRMDTDTCAKTVGFRGTPGYAAPELCSAGPVRFTPAVDVYALGAIATYLVLGDLPAELARHPPQPDDWVSRVGFARIPLRLPKPLVALLDASLSECPSDRPLATEIRQCIEKYLVLGQHRALLVHSAGTVHCDKARPKVSLAREGIGSLTIQYNELEFLISAVTGDVFINNAVAKSGGCIPESCVITLGAPELSNRRVFITMDISRPEVIL